MADIEKVYKKTKNPIIKKKFFDRDYYVLNHYKGCSYGCMYCDVITPFSTVYDKRKWGHLIEIKKDILNILRKNRNRLKNKRVYLSTLTDPYNQVEKELRLTKKVLLELKNYDLKQLLIKTRSSLILKDIDILKKIKNLTVSISIFNDNSKILSILENKSPSCDERIRTVDVLNKNNIDVDINIYPYLPEITPIHKIIRNYKDMVEKFVIIEPNWKDNSIKSTICNMLQRIEPEILVKYHTKYFKDNPKKHYLKKIKDEIEKKYSTTIKILER